jgi:hypothetical protein
MPSGANKKGQRGIYANLAGATCQKRIFHFYQKEKLGLCLSEKKRN